MSNNLIIVESPTKAKTISQFLGKDYKVESSFGHVRDLPKSKIGVDVEHDFEPSYVIPTKAKKRVSELKKLAAKAKTIYYATDEDREGEAISWHLDEIFSHPKNTHRIAFHEITKKAITEALANPREIDVNLVNAQQARRILDRLVGYELSPFLWKKVYKGLSAGRVQSVALRLVVEREREIQAFQKREYWTVEAVFSKEGHEFAATLFSIDGKKLEKFDINNEQQAQELLEKINHGQFKIASIEQKKTLKNPPAPFTTSTLQQRANRMLGYSAKQTMVLAQQLYEGIALGSSGSIGLITYMRTDSLNLANEFLAGAQNLIKEKYGAEYAKGPRRFAAKSKLAQEAHEAIRPTQVELTPGEVKPYLDAKQFKLYDLIWRRSVASQMPEAEVLVTSVDIADEQQHLFRATGSVVVFDGFMKVLPHESTKELLPDLKQGELVKTQKIEPVQHFTEPPARYSEATLIRALEDYGIGRPSTYAPTIATIEARNYVTKEQKQLKPTDIGFLVSDLLLEHFPKVVDYNFTAKIEDDFDSIAEGQLKWQSMLNDFYQPFHENVVNKNASVTKDDTMANRELGRDPKTGKPVYVKIGRFGPYVQLGSKDDVEKPTFASLKKDQSIEAITLEDALVLLSLPRVLGKDDEGNVIETNIGRFGPYLKVAGKFYSIKNDDPYTITLERAKEALKESKEKGSKNDLKTFTGSSIKVVDGRYGPYITDGKKNAKIPKDESWENLTLEQVQELIAKAPEKRGGWKKKS